MISIIPFRLQFVVLLVSVGFTGYLVYLVKKEIIELKYVLMWLLIALIMLTMAAYPKSLVVITKFLGIDLPVNALFLIGLLLALLLIFTLTIVVSKLRYRLTRLTQEIGILKMEVARLKSEYHE